MKISDLSFGELKKLIKLCGEAGISELQLGDLKVVFGGQTKAAPLNLSYVQTKDSEVQTQQIEKEALSAASKALDDSDLSIMQLEDPSRYEQLLLEGELEDDGTVDAELGDEQSRIDSALTAAPERTKASQH